MPSSAQPLAAPAADHDKRSVAKVPAMRLPTDRPRSGARFRGAVQPLELSESLSESSKKLSQREGVSPFVTLLAAFQALLSRYTSQHEIVVSCPVVARGLRENEGSAGSSTEMLSLVGDLAGDPSVTELLRRTSNSVQNAGAGQTPHVRNLPKDSALEVNRNAGPADQVLFSFVSPAPIPDSGWNSAPWDLRVGAREFDLYLEFLDGPERIRGRLHYDAELFESASISRMAGHLQTVLQGIAADPEARLSALPLSTDAERRQILVEWNNTGADYPRGLCVHQLIEDQVERTPDSLAVVCGNRSLTYRELNVRANQLAHYLVKRGVGPELLVGICLERSLELAVALLGVLKAGGACLPLDPKYPKERLVYMQEDAEAPVVLTQPSLMPRFTQAASRVVCLTPDLEIVAQEHQDNPSSGVKPENLAYVIYTSGSTGKPRGVLLPHRSLVNHHTAAKRLYGLEPTDRVLQFSSISFDIALEEIWPTWVAGGAVILRPEDMSLDATDFLRWVREQRITVLDLPTAYWHELVHELPESKELLADSLRLLIVGGEKASAAAFASWRKLTGERVRWVNTYGPSEASVIATAYEPGKHDVPSELPIGRPIANTRIYILDSHLQPAPIGIPGELYIGGDGVARGYLNRPELTAEKFVADPFNDEPGARMYRTGDLARYLPDGNVEFRGRTDYQVKIRGFRVELEEIEAALAKHANVREAAVLARESASGDKRLVSYIVPASSPPPTAGDMRTFLKESLPDYMVPAAFVMLERMPLTPNGKIDRRALPEADQLLSSPDEEVTAPRDALESQLVAIWEEVLGTKPIGVRENFFAMGGHSLLAVRLVHRIAKAFGKKLPIATLLLAPTVEQLAGVLRQDGWSPQWSSLVPIQTGGSRPAFFCVHGLGGTVMRFHALAHHLGPDQPVYGLQAQGLNPAHRCHTRVEDMAAHYIKEMRSVQPRGPYFIGGYSFGGLVAIEMARQLLNEGEEPGLAALFDTFPGKPRPNTSLLVKFLRTPARQWLPYLWRKARGHVQWHINRIWFPRRMVEVWDACFQAEQSYVPRVYPGRLTLFRPSERSLRSHEESHGGWDEWASGGVEVHEIAGDHGSITREPKVRLLAEELRVCLDRAQEASSRGPNLQSTAGNGNESQRHPVGATSSVSKI